jgi:LPXTG-site transpeptidase (sortase) family protein
MPMLVLPSKARQSRLLIRRTLCIAVVIGSALSFAFGMYIVFKKPTAPITQAQPVAIVKPVHENMSAGTARIGLPLRLRIPAINVDAAIEYVGLTQAGAMDIKPNPRDVAWYQLGPRPGEKGSAVIAGHYGWEHGQATVFTELSKLQSGDKIYVDNDQKATLPFVVRGTQRYDPSADTAAIFISSDGKSRLNLITCDGTWDAAKKTYSNRLVIFSDAAM